ncbi:hypothetical protein C8T65DRAFT_749573 [Cerioporus squamosus]|nr:hypothetical protein C8T65DRAFT_749573 [Cerioporus squamosus]
MSLRTHFNCNNVQFSSIVDTHDHTINPVEDDWQPAEVLVSEVSETGHWLMVSLKQDGAPVVVWRAIQEGWYIACDERSMTMLMHNKTPDRFTDTVQKLRFQTKKDYWEFVAHFASSRFNAYIGTWAEPAQLGFGVAA